MRPMDTAAVWLALQDVKDPEIPTISLVDMGVVRDVQREGPGVVVRFTPTFSGCPAIQEMKEAIEARVLAMGFPWVKVEQAIDPAWSSDAINARGRRCLKAFGIAPPPEHGGDLALALEEPVTCPHCDSSRTRRKNSFGPTPCKAIWYCDSCQQGFERFKPL